MRKYDGLDRADCVLWPSDAVTYRVRRRRLPGFLCRLFACLVLGGALFGCKALPLSFAREAAALVKQAVCWNLLPQPAEDDLTDCLSEYFRSL